LRLPPGPENASGRFLVLLTGGRILRLLGVELKEHRVPAEAVRDALYLPLVASLGPGVDQLLEHTNIPAERRSHARLILLNEHLGSFRTNTGWMLRVSPGASLRTQARLGRLGRPTLLMLGAYLIQQAMVVFSWWFIGRNILDGQFEPAWLWAWALILFTAIPFQLLVDWYQGYLSTAVGALFKQRLLFGALKMQPDELRSQGMGQFFGRVMESEAAELLALEGGMAAMIALIQLGIAGWVLSQGVAGALQGGMLVLWVGVTLVAGWLAYRRGRAWMGTYRNMTNQLVERMIGHRTRLAQEAPQDWHNNEDQELAQYLELSAKFDQSGITLSALPASWLVIGLACLIPQFLSTPANIGKLAISLGGVMLAYQAFGAIQAGTQSILQLGLAWGQVQPLFQAATRPDESMAASAPVMTLAPAVPLSIQEAPPGAGETRRTPLLVARNLNFRYRPFGRLALHNCSVQIFPGDRLLLEGPSGGGKSTLAAVLAGLRPFESGVLLLRGYDRQSLGGVAWRKHVVIAPQFHENHIFSETFAFNLLMGRGWPPTPEDLHEAEGICNELGLGDLLARMPSGWQQMVGENGWQLSHGERSRVFIARALLQQADLIIMDESFGALDPENLYRALECVRRRAATLLVIAHP
jgi:ATP-binding cassette, subfamily B, bacterial